MKILFLSIYSGHYQRGMETVVQELAMELGKRQHKVMVLQGGPIRKGFQDFETRSLAWRLKWPKINNTGFLRKLFLDYYSRQILGFSLKAFRQIKLFKPDILIPANGGWQSLLAKLYCGLTKARLVIMGQAGLGWDDRWNLKMKPDLFVALSKRNSRWAREHSFSQQKIVVIPNGVNLVKFKPTGLKLPLNLLRPTVLCVAGSEKYKRVKETIMAVAQLKRGSLLLVTQSSTYDKFGKEVLGKRFLRKRFTHEEMPCVYRSADIFTLVSESSEAFGIVYLEAMASKLPIVATDDFLRREIIGPAGLYIKSPQNSLLYAQKLQQALRREWGSLAAKRVKKFSWVKIASSYEKAFNQLYEKIN
ncbi:hypothetical protein A2160_02385 [Candidatus Beckwithbacteria bacterium RBG_13_42_9]|uniref:Glycosyltransferase subfamily 4-like N-terminal domain-containing protein n=1 Tax=Candidatus Beckwithbacteria bacterium RBG_13_42_9 TaxID=1797457 RepID=A0A1F5E7N4_9BACT|nr:MAG: hypothetical protein A2160_02385 [Candidatus Beckwithbacteria bacterium RBG_13_42_9]